MQTHAPSVHLRQIVDLEAMEAAKVEEAFLQGKGEGEMKDKRKHVTGADQVATTPMGPATEDINPAQNPMMSRHGQSS